MTNQPDETQLPSEQASIDTICNEFEAAVKASKPVEIADYLAQAEPHDRPALRRALNSIQALHQQPATAKPDAVKDPGLRQFVRTLVESRLMAQAEIDAFRSSLPDSEQPKTAEDLAKALYRHHKLTRFQTQAVFQGRTKGLVLGNYVVLDKVGKGGMGHVYKAQHQRMKREVALKVLPSQVSRQKEAVERFHREVVAAARLTHPNIVTAHDADEDDGVHFLVMELVEGLDLSKLVRSKGTLSVAKAIDYVTQGATGLQYAHEQGVVHRDIKPSNLLLDKAGTVKILDMGLARFEREMNESTAAESLTQSGQVMGTLDYMAPEQAMDTHHADARADVYSLGCTLYFLLTGQPVFAGDTMATKIIAHREYPVPSLRDQRGEVSEQLDQVFQKMLAKQPEERHESMAEVIRELDACRGEEQELADTMSFQAGMTGGDPTITYEHHEDDQTASPLPPISSPPPPPGHPASGSTLGGDWLKAELPEPPTVFRPPPVQSRKRQWKEQLPIIAAIATGTFVVVIMIAFFMPRPQTMLVVVVVEPGAEIYVDDQLRVPATAGNREPIEIPVAGGDHRLQVKKEGKELLARHVSVAKGRSELIDTTKTENALALDRLEQPSATPQTPPRTTLQAPTADAATHVRVEPRTTLTDPWEAVTAFAFAPDGKTLVSNGFGMGKVARWDVETAERIETAQPRDGPVFSLDFTTDGKSVAIGTYQHGTIWTINVGMNHMFRGQESSLHAVAFSPDSSLLATGSSDHTVWLWDVKTVTTLWKQRALAYDALAFSPDGRTLASGGADSMLHLWNIATGEDQEIAGHEGRLQAVAYSHDGNLIASAARDNTVRLWDANNHQQLFVLPHDDEVWGVDVSPDGKLVASGSTDGKVRLWSSNTGRLLASLTDHTGPVRHVEFSSDGKTLASSGDDKTIRLWDYAIVETTDDESSADNAAATESHLSEIEVTVTPQTTLDEFPDPVRSIAFGPEGRQLATNGNGKGILAVWDAMEGRKIASKRAHNDNVSAVDFADTGQAVAAGAYRRTTVWMLASGEMKHRFDGQPDMLISVAFSPGSQRMATMCSQDTLWLWNLSTQQIVWRAKADDHCNDALEFSPDGQLLASGGADSLVHFWDANTGNELAKLEGHSDRLTALAFSPNRRQIASASLDGTVRLWNVAQRTTQRIFEHPDKVHGVSISSDGTVLASGCEDGKVRLWDATTGVLFKELEAHTGPVRCVKFAPEGNLLASGGDDKTVRVWDVLVQSDSEHGTSPQEAPQKPSDAPPPATTKPPEDATTEPANTATRSTQLRLFPVSELNTQDNECDPWPIQDGNAIYWTTAPHGASSQIFVATRSTLDAKFSTPRLICEGREPTLTDDNRELVYLAKLAGSNYESLCSATSPSRNQRFPLARQIVALESFHSSGIPPKTPAFSTDGLALLFLGRATPAEPPALWGITRTSPSSPWGTPQKLPIVREGAAADGILTWPYLTSDGRFLFCTQEAASGESIGKLMLWRRDSTNEPFQNFAYLRVPGRGYLYGRSARLVEATGELYFAGTNTLEDQSTWHATRNASSGVSWDLWVVKNFNPASVEFGSP